MARPSPGGGSSLTVGYFGEVLMVVFDCVEEKQKARN